MRRAQHNGEPGTGTQYYTEASMNPIDDPSFDDDVDPRDARRWHGAGRTWECGRDYLDVEMRDVAKLTAVVRKSSWCSTIPAEEAPVFLAFEFERGASLEYSPTHPNEDPTERFLERYRKPTNRGP